MNAPTFDKEPWIQRYSAEIGLGHVPYEELHLYYVDIGRVFDKFDINDPNTKTARQYVDEQLAQTEDAYAQLALMEGFSEVVPVVEPIPVASLQGLVHQALNDAVEYIDSLPPAMLNLPPILLEEPNSQILASDLKYFDVVINENPFIVVINDHGGDIRIKDQIRHITNTTFFVEMRDPSTITDSSRVISYYQFVNAIPLQYPDRSDVQVQIEANIVTEFDGPRLDGILS